MFKCLKSTKSEKVSKNENGFTLIELMVTVAIIGILAAIALPEVMAFSTRAKQAEAKLNIGTIRTMLDVHYAEHDTYYTGVDVTDPDNPVDTFELTGIGYVTPDNARYVYSVAFNSATEYTITATTQGGTDLDSDATVDTWQLSNYGDSSGLLLCTSDDSVQ